MNAVSFEFWVKLFKLPKEDNLHIEDKMPAPNLSVIRRFYCTIDYVTYNIYG